MGQVCQPGAIAKIRPGGFPVSKSGEKWGTRKGVSEKCGPNYENIKSQAPNGREPRRPQVPAAGLELESGAEDLKATSRGDLALNPGGGVLGEFSGVLQIELPFDLLTIILNGLDTQVQFFRNIARFFPLAD